MNGEVILYADVKTQSIQKFLAVSNYRREKQIAYNTERGIDPQPLRKKIADILDDIARVPDVLVCSGDRDTIQLVNDGKRWWVVTIFWQQETPDNPIPAQYLK
mgnify:CR=1 FL=1